MHVAAPPAEFRVKGTSPLRLALVVAVAHGINDAYASFVPPLLPRIMDDLGLSIALAATLAVVFSVASSLPQPLFGYLADRHGRRAFAVLGPVVAGVFMALIGWASGFWMLVVVLTVAGIGSAAFHPPGASYAVRVSEGKGGGARYSVFAFGGSIGFALGPIIAVGLVQARGMRGLWIAMIPVLLLAPLIYRGLPSGRGEAAATHRPPPPPPAEVLRHLRGPLGLLFGISATMSFVQRAFLTMEPIIVADTGGSETLGAVVLTVYLGAQAFGTIVGGVLTDRVERRVLLGTLCVWSFLAHGAAVWIGPQGTLGLVAAGVAGLMGMAVIPPVVVMAQELLPNNTSAGSAIVMGLAWATGSVAVLGTGMLADALGPRPATLMSMPAALFAVWLTTRLAPSEGTVTAPPNKAGVAERG